MNALHFKKLFKGLLVLLCITQLNSQMIPSAPICSVNGSIIYSILANVTNYLQHNNNIDKRTFFNGVNDLKGAKIGVLPGFSLTNKDNYDEVITFPNTQDLINGLKNHTIDGVIVDKSTSDYIILHNYDLYKIPEKTDRIQYGLFFKKKMNSKKNSTIFLQKIIFKYNGKMEWN